MNYESDVYNTDQLYDIQLYFELSLLLQLFLEDYIL